jgi:hypothetical protein
MDIKELREWSALDFGGGGGGGSVSRVSVLAGVVHHRLDFPLQICN